MPPRKSNVSQVSATGEDGTPAKEREGINIEVGLNTLTSVLCSPIKCLHSFNHLQWPNCGLLLPYSPLSWLFFPSQNPMTYNLPRPTGPLSPPHNGPTSRQRCPPRQHFLTQRRHPRHEQRRHRLHKLPRPHRQLRLPFHRQAQHPA